PGDDDAVIADELGTRPDAFALRLRDRRDDGDPATGPEEAEGDAEPVTRGQRPAPVDDQRDLGRGGQRLGGSPELGEQGRLESCVGWAQPRDPVAAVRVDVRIVLREDLCDAVAPAERVVEGDLAGCEK